MSEVFISYARANERRATQLAALIRARGFTVWRDEEIPPHRAFGDVIAERLEASLAVAVVWSHEAGQSQWVRAEAEHGRVHKKLVQVSLDGAPLPLPFNQIQCEDLTGWCGEPDAAGVEKLLDSLAALVGRDVVTPVHGEHGALFDDARITLHVAIAGAGGDLPEELRHDIAGALGRLPALHVVPGLKVRPDYRVEVQAREAGGRLRATIRLLALPAGEQLWTERFDGDGANIFAWQDGLTETVAANVEAIVRRARLARTTGASAATTASPTARRLAASAAINRMSAASYREALALLAPDLASDLTTPEPDPEAPALGAIARASLWVGGYAGTGEADRADGIALAQRALRLTDSSPFPTGLSAVSLALLGRPVEPSMALVDRVLALTPGFAPALMWAGQVRLIGGDATGAAERLEEARRLDPRMAVRSILLGYLAAARMLEGDLGAARRLLLEAGETTDLLPMNNVFLAATHGLLGDRPAAEEALDRARRIAPPEAFRLPLVPAHRARLAEGLDL